MNSDKKTINPYFYGLSLILHRLLWDFHPYSWISRKRLKALHNSHKNQKAIILCNGPSLNSVDFNAIIDSETYTFGLNKINLLFSKTDFRPSSIVALNLHVIEQNADFYNKTKIPLFLDSRGRKWIRCKDNLIFLHSEKIKSGFAQNCSSSINQGHTVTYVAMQIAFHMGFNAVALVGCDHSFSSPGIANKEIISNSVDPNHFDSKYFSSGQIWQYPDLIGSEYHYQIAKKIYEQYGRKIFNCTVGGKLELFERKLLDEFLNTAGPRITSPK